MMRSNVQLYRIKQRKKIELLKLKLRYDYRCDLLKEMKLTRYGIWRKQSMREDELQRRELVLDPGGMARSSFRAYSIFELELGQVSHRHVLARHGKTVFLQMIDPGETTAATACLGDINGSSWLA